MGQITRSRRAQIQREATTIRMHGQREGFPLERIVTTMRSNFPELSPLEAWRLALGWSRAQAITQVAGLYLADGLKPPALSEAMLCRFEHGPDQPGPEYATMLARAYGAHPGQLGLKHRCVCGYSDQRYGQSDETHHGQACLNPDASPAILENTRVDPHGAGEDEIVKRRQFLASVAGSALLGSAANQPDETITSRLERLLIRDTAAAPASLVTLSAQLSSAQAALADTRYATLSITLPQLVAAATTTAAAATGRQREHLYVLLAHAYILTAELATKIHTDGAMAWVAADRALHAAHTSGDVLTVAAASRQVAIAMRRQGRHASATDLLTHTALRLDAGTGQPDPAVLGVYTKLLCTAAYASAQAGAQHQAMDLINEAELAAQRLTSRPTPTADPTPATVAVYRISVHNALGDPAAALEQARNVQTHLLPTPERYARYCIDTARAWHAYGNRDQAVNAILAAERTAPEEVRRPSVTALISGMQYAPGPVSAPLHALAARTHAT